MGDAFFKNNVDKKHFIIFVFHMGFHRNSVICLKIVTSRIGDCSIMSIYSTIKLNNFADKNMQSP